MAIPEAQLNTWASLGAIATSRDTYASVKRALEAPGVGYCGMNYEVFLQGSYGNDTNVYAESDVDVVICLNDLYYSDTSALNQEHAASFNRAFVQAIYTYEHFKIHVTGALRAAFGNAVADGGKAIKIAPSGARRSADVVVAAEFQRHYSGTVVPGHYIERGICFFTAADGRIVNYPKQHAANCVSKHEATNQWFKPTVRIFKNMRNRLVSSNVIERRLAPSYFIEGLLYNVPVDRFGGSYAATVLGIINWVRSLDQQALNKLVCANREHFLIREGSPICWSYNGYDRFFSALATLWNQWQ